MSFYLKQFKTFSKISIESISIGCFIVFVNSFISKLDTFVGLFGFIELFYNSNKDS